MDEDQIWSKRRDIIINTKQSKQIMHKADKLMEIETLWISRDRDYQWEAIQWDAFTYEGKPLHKRYTGVANKLMAPGYYFVSWDLSGAPSGWAKWDWTLLRLLYAWYALPEMSNSPLFVSERTRTVCIARPAHAARLGKLFNHSDSVHLGMRV